MVLLWLQTSVIIKRGNEDLSIKVYPKNELGKKRNTVLEKTKCWYVLDCIDNATIVLGHNAKDKKELFDMIKNHRLKEFVRKIPIKKNDCFRINSGCPHSVNKGALILEIKQNVDGIYTIFDNKRTITPFMLHKSVSIIDTPYKDVKPENNITFFGNIIRENLVGTENYTVEKIDINGRAEIGQPYNFLCVMIIDGYGVIDEFPIKKGDSFIIPYG